MSTYNETQTQLIINVMTQADFKQAVENEQITDFMLTLITDDDEGGTNGDN